MTEHEYLTRVTLPGEPPTPWEKQRAENARRAARRAAQEVGAQHADRLGRRALAVYAEAYERGRSGLGTSWVGEVWLHWRIGRGRRPAAEARTQGTPPWATPT